VATAAENRLSFRAIRIRRFCCGVGIAAGKSLDISAKLAQRGIMNERGKAFSAVDARKLAMGCLCVPKIVDVTVRRTDAGCQPPYLPQATEEVMAFIPLKHAPGLPRSPARKSAGVPNENCGKY
jgi:hypothetical protein